MKELTKGKLAAIILFVIFISNTTIYILLNGIPYKTPFYEADGWTAITGLTIGWFFMFTAGALIFYIFDKWEEKI